MLLLCSVNVCPSIVDFIPDDGANAQFLKVFALSTPERGGDQILRMSLGPPPPSAFKFLFYEGNSVRPVSLVAVIERIKVLRERGSIYREIAAQLNDAGLPTKRGGQWQPTTVRNIIVRA